MQPREKRFALKISALLIGGSGIFTAAADTFNLTVNTIADVAVAEVTPLDFGENIVTTANTTCAMDADQPADATVFADGGLTATTYGVLTGTGCVGSGTTVATPGVYSITGLSNLDVTLTLTDEAQAGGDFTFSPDGGCGVVHDNASGGDVCSAITAGTPITLHIASSSDDGSSVDGTTHFTVGGTINVGATGLTSDTNYTATFLVNVVY